MSRSTSSGCARSWSASRSRSCGSRSPFVLRTVAPSPRALEGAVVETVERLGKRIVIGVAGDRYLVIHLMIAGRLRWKKQGEKLPAKVGLVGFDFPTGTLIFTEASPKKRASLHLVAGRAGLAEFDRGGLDVFTATADEFATRLRSERHTVKRSLTDPTLFDGIGNAYSDEILHAAKLSPFRMTSAMTDAEIATLHRACVDVLTVWTQRTRDEVGDGFPDKVTAFRPEMAVHGKYGAAVPGVWHRRPADRLRRQRGQLLSDLSDRREAARGSFAVAPAQGGLAQDPGRARGPQGGRGPAGAGEGNEGQTALDHRTGPCVWAGTMKKLLAGILMSAALAGCGPKHASFVKVDDVALGRVVIYRNGVAYYERRATVSGGILTVSVPRDRVDDFLKSLTVVDAISKQPLPVSIPRQQADDGAYLVMKLQLPSKAPADVVLTYVTESPAWKPSYRVVVGDKGKVMLEGWAIVDNTSGEDWKGVPRRRRLELGACRSSTTCGACARSSARPSRPRRSSRSHRRAACRPTGAARPPVPTRTVRSRSPSSATTRSVARWDTRRTRTPRGSR